MLLGLMSSLQLCKQSALSKKKPRPSPLSLDKVPCFAGVHLRDPKAQPPSNKDYVIDIPNTPPSCLLYRNESFLPRDGEDGVVAAGSPSGRVDEDVDGLVDDGLRRPLREHDVQVHGPEDLLQRVEGQPAQLALNQIGPVLHDRLELHVPVPALPPRDEVQHVRALGGLALLPAGVAGQRHRERREEGEVGRLVAHSEEPREEVDLAGHGGDGQEACRPHD